MPPMDSPDAAGDSLWSAPVFVLTLDERAVQAWTVELDPAVVHFTARPPVQAFAMLDDNPTQRPVRLEHNADGRRALFLDGNRQVRQWFRAHCRPGDTLEVRILGPVQFWLRRI